MRRPLTPELVVSLASALVLFFASSWLYLDFSAKGEGAGAVIGSVVFLSGEGGRRPAGRVVWGRLEDSDPVYRDDTVRAGHETEVLLDLKDGTSIEMEPLSMIVLNVREDLREIEVLEGSVLVRPGGERGWRLKSEGQARTPLGPTRLTRTADGDVVWRPPEEDESGATGAVATGADPVQPAPGKGPVALAPAENTRFFTDTAPNSAGVPGTHAVQFLWRKPVPGADRLIVARGPDMSAIVFDGTVAADRQIVALGPGRYFWSLKDALDRAGPVFRFSVLPREEPVLIAPGAGPFAGPVPFVWRGPRGASYRLEVARDAAFQDVPVDQQVHRTGITLSFAPGRYHWRLTALGYFPEASARSVTRSFIVAAPGETPVTATPPGVPPVMPPVMPAPPPDASGERSQPPTPPAVDLKLAPPLPIFPGNLAALDMAERDAILFRWTVVPGARAYQFRLAAADQPNVPVFAAVVGTSYINFTKLDVLDEGEFLWTVDAVVPGGAGERTVRGTGRFFVTLSERPGQPELDTQ